MIQNSRKILSLFALVSILSLFWTLVQNYEEFSQYELIIFTLYALSVFLFEAGLIALAAAQRYAVFAVAGFFSAINLYTLIIVHNSRFSALPDFVVVTIILAMSAILAVMYFVPNENFQKFITRFCQVMIALVLVQFFTGAVSADSFKKLPDHFQIPEFTKKPNVYVVTFDTLAPERVLKENVGLSVPFDDQIRAEGGRIIPNTFADRIPTKSSLNSFHAMDLEYFDSFDKKNRFLLNKSPNPVYEIFRANGYKIGFVYETSYFGADHGKLDYYGVGRLDGLCKHVEKSYALAGYCLEPVRTALRPLRRSKDHDYPALLFEQIRAVSKTENPWFIHAHIYMPGHAKNSFNPYKRGDWEEFRPYYTEKSLKATEMMKTLFATVKENDPDAILVIFGDHGALVSRTLLGDEDIMPNALAFDPAKLSPDSPLTYKQIVQDRHGVLAAVYPKNFCPEGFRQNPYSTTRLMRDVVKCLSGKDPLPGNFQPDDQRWGPYSYQ